LAAAIRDAFGIESKLVRLSNGIFKVYVDGNKIFDKHKEHRFPEEREVLATIKSLQESR
jgi:selT/selW/selH-like putative selenoprotein